MKNKMIFITLILILITSVVCLPNKAYAANSLSEIITEGDDFIGARSKDEVIDTDALKDTSDFIYKTLLIIAIVLAFIVGMIIGIQFIIGSAEEKAKIKETLIPYIVGLIVVFGAFTIWKIVVNLGNDISPTVEASGSTEKTEEKYVACPGCTDGKIIYSLNKIKDGTCTRCENNHSLHYCRICESVYTGTEKNHKIEAGH